MNRPPLAPRALAILASLFIFCVQSSAATLLSYSFSGKTPAAPALGDGNVSGSDASWVGITSAQLGFGGSSSTAYARTDGLPTAFDAGKYLTFTVSAAPGFALDLSSLSFDLGGSSNSPLASGVVYAVVRTDAESTPFSTDLPLSPGPVTVASQAISANESPTPSAYSLDLGGAQYQNLTHLTFRVYVYSSTQSSNLYLRFNSFAVNGEVASVPEPGAYSALLLGTAVAWGLCRRKARV